MGFSYGPDSIVIALVGEVSSGKSSLVNALAGTLVCRVNARAGETREVARFTFQHSQWTAGLPVVIVDTPGLQETSGEDRAQKAIEAATEADLVLCVIDGDISETEYRAIVELHENAKPIIVAINKADTYSRAQLDTIEKQVKQRLKKIIQAEHIICCAAEPLKTKVVVDQEGRESPAEVKATPEILRLRQLIGDTLARERDNLVRIRDIKHLEERHRKEIEKQGNKLVEDYSYGIAIGVAVNPIPLVDFLGAGAALAGMIYHLTDKLDVKMSQSEVNKLVESLWDAAKGLLSNVIFGAMAASAAKIIPGIGTLVGWAIQAALGGYVAQIIGCTAVQYFANDCSWGGSNAHEVMKQIIQTTDKDAIVAQIKDKLKNKGISSKPRATSTPNLHELPKASPAELKRVQCKQCGASMLARTAKRTGGLCISCLKRREAVSVPESRGRAKLRY